ncbi:MAG TPA: hypothetical protein VFX50_14795, partial [Gemmatimonadales bacterium]|nr:hypothetical protein [Gemmatimonadales bacterium]
IAQLVAGEIGRSSGGQVADRASTQQAAGPRTAAGRVDAASAQRIGGLVGARYVVTGNFVDAFGKMRVNARIVDVQSGQFLQAVTNDDPSLHDRAKLHASIQYVSRKLLEGLKLAPPAPGPAIGLEAILAYSLGLAAEEKGERETAAGHYRVALERASGFAEAQEALQRVR